MGDRVDVSPRDFEDLYVAFYRRACETIPDLQQHVDEDLYWLVTGIPLPIPNAVVRTRWPDQPAEMTRELVATTLRPYQMRQVPMMWYVWPTSTPADLGGHLVAAGLAAGGETPMMARDLSLPLPAAELPAGARIEQVNDVETLARWSGVAVDGFGFEGRNRTAALSLFRILGYEAPMLQYLAWMDDEPVAAATLVLHAELAGIFNVTTLPQARGRGIGAAISARCLVDARDAGCHFALLTASAMGEPVYRRLGFETYGVVANYFWSPHVAV